MNWVKGSLFFVQVTRGKNSKRRFCPPPSPLLPFSFLYVVGFIFIKFKKKITENVSNEIISRRKILPIRTRGDV